MATFAVASNAGLARESTGSGSLFVETIKGTLMKRRPSNFMVRLLRFIIRVRPSLLLSGALARSSHAVVGLSIPGKSQLLFWVEDEALRAAGELFQLGRGRRQRDARNDRHDRRRGANSSATYVLYYDIMPFLQKALFPCLETAGC